MQQINQVSLLRRRCRKLRSRGGWKAFAMSLMLASTSFGCAHDVRVRYPDEEAGDHGMLTVMLDDAADVTVAVNGRLLVDDVRTKRVEISNLPTGYVELAVAAGGSAQQTRVWITAEHPTALPMGAPAAGSQGLVAGLLSTAVSVAVYVLTRRWL